MKIKKPKHGAFFVYCYECKHWQYRETVGCAILGVCTAIKDNHTQQDAYDPPCGLFCKTT